MKFLKSMQRGGVSLIGIGAVIVALLLGLAFYVANIERVPVGHVGIKVHLVGDGKGVDNEELGPGRHFIGFNEQLFTFPTFTQTVGWTKESNPELGSSNNEEFSFQTAEGMTAQADIGASVSVDPTKVSALFQKFRKGMPEIMDLYVRRTIENALVQKAGKLEIESVYGAGTAELINQLHADVKAELATLGINLEKLYWIGAIRLPPQVVESINGKSKATQDAQKRENQVQTERAQADINRTRAQGEADSALIIAEAQAKANKLLSASLTPEVLQHKNLENQAAAIVKWNGANSQVVAGGSNTPLMIQVPQVK